MKASRAAIKAANNLAELAAQVVSMQEQLNRIEEMLKAATAPKVEEPLKAKTGK